MQLPFFRIYILLFFEDLNIKTEWTQSLLRTYYLIHRLNQLFSKFQGYICGKHIHLNNAKVYIRQTFSPGLQCVQPTSLTP